MTTGRVITEDVLRGIDQALKNHAPRLLPQLHEICRYGLVDGPEGKAGSSVFGKLTATISWKDGEPILRALEEVERKCVYNAVFGGRQINWLVQCWRKFVEPIQVNQKGDASEEFEK